VSERSSSSPSVNITLYAKFCVRVCVCDFDKLYFTVQILGACVRFLCAYVRGVHRCVYTNACVRKKECVSLSLLLLSQNRAPIYQHKYELIHKHQTLTMPIAGNTLVIVPSNTPYVGNSLITFAPISSVLSLSISISSPTASR